MIAGSPVLEVVAELDALAASGAAPGEIVAEAGTAIARWWWEGRGDGQPDRIVGLVAELVLWCAVAAFEHEAGSERLARAGRMTEAEEAGRRSWAFREACCALGRLVGV